MSSYSRRRAQSLAGLFATFVLSPAAALAAEGPGPSYTYLGAGYEWGDSRCAVEPSSGGLSGYTAEGSIGILKFLHLTGTYYDGDGDFNVLDEEGDSAKENFNVKCYELGAGLSYTFAPGADVVLRGNYVKVDSDDASGSADGFEPQLLVRYMMSEKAEIEVGMMYFDMSPDHGDSFSNTEVRVAVDYRVLPWLAVRVGGSVFDDDSAINAGVRAYFGSNLF